MSRRKRSTFTRGRTTSSYLGHLQAGNMAAVAERELKLASIARHIAARITGKGGSAS